MFLENYGSKRNPLISLSKKLIPFRLSVLIIILFACLNIYSQIQTQYFGQQPSQPSTSGSSVFRQEIARLEITVTRDGKQPLSLTQVPRVQKGDIIKLRLLDEPVNGIKIDQTQWDWTLLVAFINPLHRMIDTPGGGDKPSNTGTVSEEIQFRKRGWYKQYSFIVPYDSQPVFFLYPKSQYRKQLVKLVNSKYDEIRKLGEKTIELSDAYSKINTFVNEMQMVLNRNAQIFGYNNLNNPLNNSSTYNPYGSSYNSYGSTYNPYGTTYNPYGTTTTTTSTSQNLTPNVPIFGLPTIPALNQMVEGLAKSFNIQLPSCWGNGSGYGNTYGSAYGSGYGNTYGSYASTYNSGYLGYGNYGSSQYGSIYGNNAAVMDFINRSQCVARNINLQDFDISVTRMWQQGGVFLAAELQRKYPQFAYYINIAAAAIDFIVKVFQKSPLRIVPTVIQSNDPQGGFNNNGSIGGMYGNQYPSGYSNNLTPNPTSNQNSGQTPVRISLFADSQPSEGAFTTAYPIVVHKWQANPDPEVISLYSPILAESCLHVGTNILKSIDLTSQLSDDVYARDFRLILSSSNGFKKEFPLRKNMGVGGWEMAVTPEDMNQIPKINMGLEAELVGTRGFNDIKSPKFNLPISLGGNYEITAESQKAFSVGGKRVVTLKNTLGSCRCLQRVIYKPSFGGTFVFENTTDQNSPNSLVYSADGSEVSFEIDANNFQPGTGTLEINAYGNENQPSLQSNQTSSQSLNTLPIKLYPAPPVISDVKVGRGDREILITGERLEQLQAVYINGKKALIKDNPATGQNESATNIVPDQKTAQVQPAPANPPQSSTASAWNLSSNQTATPVATQASNTAPSPVSPSSQYQKIGSNQRTAVFEDPSTRINSKTIILELELEDNRSVIYPNQFPVGLARPMLQADNQNEIEGIFLNQSLPNEWREPTTAPSGVLRGKNNEARAIRESSQIDLSGYPVVSINKSAMTVAVKNILSDYSFRNENLSVETRIENAAYNPSELPAVTFDVLDGDNLRLNFTTNRTINKNLSGRRLQFRIVDRERGASDWYSIRQTFVRTPEIESVICTGEMNNQCELKGNGIDYIAQVSVDGGKSWFPQTGTGSVQVQPTVDGKTMMRIPILNNPKLLQIKLRDYPNTEGLEVSNFVFSNRLRKNGSNSPVTGIQPNSNQLTKRKAGQQSK